MALQVNLLSIDLENKRGTINIADDSLAIDGSIVSASVVVDLGGGETIDQAKAKLKTKAKVALQQAIALL